MTEQDDRVALLMAGAVWLAVIGALAAPVWQSVRGDVATASERTALTVGELAQIATVAVALAALFISFWSYRRMMEQQRLQHQVEQGIALVARWKRETEPDPDIAILFFAEVAFLAAQGHLRVEYIALHWAQEIRQFAAVARPKLNPDRARDLEWLAGLMPVPER